MNRHQYLLSKLAEEAAEVAQIVLKTQQFGASEVYPQQDLTNAERIHLELDDLYAVVEMLNKEYSFGYSPSRKRIETKKKKVNYYCEFAKSLGEVTE